MSSDKIDYLKSLEKFVNTVVFISYFNFSFFLLLLLYSGSERFGRKQRCYFQGIGINQLRYGKNVKDNFSYLGNQSIFFLKKKIDMNLVEEGRRKVRCREV